MKDIDAQLTGELQAANLGGLEWCERIRMGLWTVLRFFDREPALARFSVVESARGDERIAAYRAKLLARLADRGLIHNAARAGRHPSRPGGDMIGVACTLIQTHLQRKDPRPLVALTGTIAGLIALPYLGSRAAIEQMTLGEPIANQQLQPNPDTQQETA